jgi:hypothetical protein
MENIKTISGKEIKNLKIEGKITFMGSNEHQVNNQGNYTFNENGLYKQQNSALKIVFHKIATFTKDI